MSDSRKPLLRRGSCATPFRLYEPHELLADGYPAAWHELVKHQVREDAGHRCIRCLHPYRRGEHGRCEWSPCDDQCQHHGDPGRLVRGEGEDLGVMLSWPQPQDTGPRARERHEVALELLSHFPTSDRRIEAQWRILTVHHLDGCKANCRWWNLAALCQRCHLQIQGKVQMARVWPWEHSGWFRPYVAGYYAHVYLDEDLDRDQVDARLDELLDLERMAA